MGKGYDGLPACLKTFIGAMFKTIDIDGMVLVFLQQNLFVVMRFSVKSNQRFKDINISQTGLKSLYMCYPIVT